MRVIVNGEAMDVPEGSTLRDLIARLGLSGGPVAAEVNKALVPKRQHEQRRLDEGDTVELVTLVGGG